MVIAERMIMFNLIIAAVLLLLFYKLPKTLFSHNKQNISVMDKDGTMTLRGAAIIGIVIHHCSQYFDDLGVFQIPVKQSGYALTAIFFLFSGYGCYHSLRTAPPPRKNVRTTAVWTVRHSLRIYFDFIIVFLINIILFKAFSIEDGMSAAELLKDAVTLTEPTWTSWYPKIQILCYVVLAVSFLISNKYKEIITFAVLSVYVIVMWSLGFESMWYTSVLCFPLGMLFAKYLPEFKSKKIYAAAFVISGVVFAALFVLQTKMLTGPIRLISACVLSVVIYSLTGLYKFDNFILKSIGQISFEIYLIHLVLLRIFVKENVNANISIILILLISILLAFPVNKLVVGINSSIFNRKKD